MINFFKGYFTEFYLCWFSYMNSFFGKSSWSLRHALEIISNFISFTKTWCKFQGIEADSRSFLRLEIFWAIALIYSMHEQNFDFVPPIKQKSQKSLNLSRLSPHTLSLSVLRSWNPWWRCQGLFRVLSNDILRIFIPKK